MSASQEQPEFSVKKSNISADMIIKIADTLSKSLCVDVIAYDVSNIYDYVDYSIIASTTSDTHRKGVLSQLITFLQEEGLLEYAKLASAHVKSQKQSGWVLVDFYDFVIHLMDADVREFYNFEKLLSKADVIFDTK